MRSAGGMAFSAFMRSAGAGAAARLPSTCEKVVGSAASGVSMVVRCTPRTPPLGDQRMADRSAATWSWWAAACNNATCVGTSEPNSCNPDSKTSGATTASCSVAGAVHATACLGDGFEQNSNPLDVDGACCTATTPPVSSIAVCHVTVVCPVSRSIDACSDALDAPGGCTGRESVTSVKHQAPSCSTWAAEAAMASHTEGRAGSMERKARDGCCMLAAKTTREGDASVTRCTSACDRPLHDTWCIVKTYLHGRGDPAAPGVPVDGLDARPWLGSRCHHRVGICSLCAKAGDAHPRRPSKRQRRGLPLGRRHAVPPLHGALDVRVERAQVQRGCRPLVLHECQGLLQRGEARGCLLVAAVALARVQEQWGL